MMDILFFFDIPIYRLRKEKYYAERESYIEKQMYGTDPEEVALRKAFYERNRDNAILFRDHLEKIYGGPWDFNEIIGYIRLHFLGSQIRGELWTVSKKRLVRTRQKLFLYKTQKVVPEKDILLPASNEEIYRIICEYLEDAKKQLKGRFIDTSTFERLGRYIDWNGLKNDA
jgi:hypothetical protein